MLLSLEQSGVCLHVDINMQAKLKIPFVLIACCIDHNAQHLRVQSIASAATSVNKQQKAFNIV